MTWAQLYRLDHLPEHLVVVGSGVTGAEFAGAYNALGARVTLVSSRNRVLPGEDEEAAELIETVFRRRGMTVLSRSRAAAVRRTDDGVAVELSDGRVVEGSHCLVAVGAVPNTAGIGLEEAGVRLTPSGHVQVDRVSRTTAFRIYAAGDCTGVLPSRPSPPCRAASPCGTRSATPSRPWTPGPWPPTSSPPPRSRRSG